MQHKAIKAEIRKQLKTRYPKWQWLTKKEKKATAKRVLDEVVKEFDFEQEVTTPLDVLLGIDSQVPTASITDLDEMERFVKSCKDSVLFRLNRKKGHPLHIKDKELRFIDDLLDDKIVNKLLSYDGYTPAMRDLFPCNFLRAELLKAIKYPEISYRKFCGDENDYEGHKVNSSFIGMESKQNRAFIGLPLNRKQMLSHVQMCQFRAGLTFSQLVNLMVYVLYHLRERGILGEDSIHCVDSTELAVERQQLLAVLKVKGKNIRIYDDIDCDCGKRRKKRDKSVYVVGYRMHTLTAINPKTGHSLPLISLLAPANHHDSHFLSPLVRLGKAIGLDLKLITADEAYHDKDGSMLKESGVHLVKPPNSKVCLPENVDAGTLQVTLDDLCDVPMKYIGIEEQVHEFKCGAQPGQCHRSELCPKFRHIDFDDGYFQRILHGSDLVSDALDIRKNGERPFNLLKKREGLEQVRVRSHHGVVARSAFTTMATLLLELAGTRRTKKVKQKQLSLSSVA
jgi:hypothetical protein